MTLTPVSKTITDAAIAKAKARSKTGVVSMELTPAVIHYLNILWEGGARKLHFATPYKTIFKIVYPHKEWKHFFAKMMKRAFCLWEIHRQMPIDALIYGMDTKMRKDSKWVGQWTSAFTREEAKEIAATQVSKIETEEQLLGLLIECAQRPADVIKRSHAEDIEAYISRNVDMLKRRLEQMRASHKQIEDLNEKLGHERVS